MKTYWKWRLEYEMEHVTITYGKTTLQPNASEVQSIVKPVVNKRGEECQPTQS